MRSSGVVAQYATFCDLQPVLYMYLVCLKQLKLERIFSDQKPATPAWAYQAVVANSWKRKNLLLNNQQTITNFIIQYHEEPKTEGYFQSMFGLFYSPLKLFNPAFLGSAVLNLERWQNWSQIFWCARLHDIAYHMLAAA